MTWLWILIAVIAIAAIIGYISNGKKGAVGAGVTAGIGCGGIMLQIFLWLLGIFLLFQIGSCLFS